MRHLFLPQLRQNNPFFIFFFFMYWTIISHWYSELVYICHIWLKYQVHVLMVQLCPCRWLTVNLVYFINKKILVFFLRSHILKSGSILERRQQFSPNLDSGRSVLVSDSLNFYSIHDWRSHQQFNIRRSNTAGDWGFQIRSRWKSVAHNKALTRTFSFYIK